MDSLQSSFGTLNFGNADLGDKRRTKRLVRLVDTMCRHPGGTLPDKLNRPADLRAFYRLMNCSSTTHEVLIRSHARRTQARIAGLAEDTAVPTVLIVHDATELDYTSRTSLAAHMGQIGKGSRRGYICHNSLAITAGGDVLGLLSQILHHRADVPKGETVKQSRERDDRESRLWVQSATACGQAPGGVRSVDVSDSLSDTFEYLFYEVTHQRHFVLRSREERRLERALAGENYLYPAIRKVPALSQRQIKVLHGPGRKARTTTVNVAYSPVELAAPRKKFGEYQRVSLRLWAVRVWEPNTPADEEPLEWILLTNVAVTNTDDAEERIGWYEKRPIIEEFHKGMKTGCSIEEMQFDKLERLEPAIALLSVVTTTLLNLRDAARAKEGDKRPASDVVDAEYVTVLKAHYASRMSAVPTAREFYMHVARLGGHQNRKCDGYPGWLTLWRGWMKLQAMLDGYHAARGPARKCGKT